MTRTILYYPTINIPTTNWLRHALLYWDEISSIVPGTPRMIDELSQDIQYLHDEKQFRPIRPEELIRNGDNWDAFHEFRNEFIQIVESEFYHQSLQRSYGIHERIHVDILGDQNLYRIHFNKISDAVLYPLEQLGLAKRQNGNYEWAYFEKNTALLYMSLLAKYLADLDYNHTVIGTDLKEYERFNFKRVDENIGFPVISFNLDNVLPSPKDNVSFEKIVSFKRKREDNLIHFKKFLSDFQTKISNSSSQAELKEIAINFKDELAIGVKDLNAVLSDSKIDTTFKSLKSLVNIKSPTLFVTTSTSIAEKFDMISLPLNLAMIGIVGSIELTSNYIELRNKDRTKLRESSFSYIYEAKKAGIIS